MIPSLLTVIFVVCMVWMWSHQGLFSALIHLVLTILAGTLAFAFWEPLVYGFLLNRMPEQAWGFGLVVPFGVILLVLRTVFDKVVTGNLFFPNIANKVGGGAMGFVSGVLTAGILVLGVQRVGMPSVAGYQAYQFDDATGEVVRKDKLLIPVDVIASDFFSMLSGGSMSPMLGNSTIPRLHPNLAQEASFHHQSAFWSQGIESGYRALPPGNVKFTTEAQGPARSELSDVPPSIAAAGVAKDPSKQVVVVGTDIALQSQESGTVAADSGGLFRITRAQVALATQAGGQVNLYYPQGWIWERTYFPMKVKDEYAWSQSASNSVYHWVFQVPTGEKPIYLTLKGTRFELPPEVNTEVAAVERLIGGGGGIATSPPDNGTDPNVEQPEGSALITVNPGLTRRMSKNRLPIVEVTIEEKNGFNCLVSTSSEVRYVPAQDDRSLGAKAVVERICHADNQRVVRVDLGQRQKPQSYFGKILNAAAQVVPPELVAASGKRYQAIGYLRTSGAAINFKIDPTNKLRSVSEIGLANVTGNDVAFLFFHVDVGETITSFEIGRGIKVTDSAVNVPVQ